MTTQTPRSLQCAAALVGLQGAALGVWGLVEVIRSLVGHPHDRATAILLGVVVLIYAAGVLVAAVGLLRARRWAQTPAYLVQFFSVVIGIGQIHTLPAMMIPLIVVAVGAFVALSLPDSRHALGGI